MKNCVAATLFAIASVASSAEAPLNSHNLCSQTRETRIDLADSVITDAATKGDIEALKRAFQAGVSPNVTTDEGFSLLHIAITENQDAVLALLLRQGVDVNQPFMGTSPLSLLALTNRAGMPNDLQREKQLIKAGAKLSDYDLARTAVLKFGFRTFADGFVDAIKAGDKTRLDVYARATYDINQPMAAEILPLQIAALQGTPDAVRYLAACGANVNARSKKGTSIIGFARGRPEVIAVLQSLGAVEDD
jgi:ankyrin repeat protein